MKNWDIVILGGARDFHAMDWYRAVKRICEKKSVVFLTDSLEAEGLNDLSQPGDQIEKLFIIDSFLPQRMQIWLRPWKIFVKLAFLPIQIILLRRFYFASGRPIIHAHPMYFMLLSRLARVPFIGTPQGDELLIHPQKNKLYKLIARWVLQGSSSVIVDSEQMKKAAKDISYIEAHVIQNGINMAEINSVAKTKAPRFRIVSNRGLMEIYQIDKIMHARDAQLPNLGITFSYPFANPDYQGIISQLMTEKDENIGRLELKVDLYKILRETLLVVSIPKSDSSPRSIYEAIFCGCCIAATPNPWIDALPLTMRSRIYIVDLDNPRWLEEAYEFSSLANRIPFEPCEDSINTYDEDSSLRIAVEKFYFNQ